MASIAEIRNCPEVSHMSQSLALIFRYSLNMKDPFSTVENEIVHLKNYIYVMDMRMHDNIQYTFDVDEMTLKVNCHDFHCSRLWRMQLIMVCVIKEEKENWDTDKTRADGSGYLYRR